MLWPAGSAQRIRYDSVERPAAEFIRPVDDVRPVDRQRVHHQRLPVSPLPDNPFPDRPLVIERPLVNERPLIIERPLVDTSSLSEAPPASLLPGAWQPVNTAASASAVAMRVEILESLHGPE